MNKKKISLEKFIEGGKEDKKIKRARRRTSYENILLSVIGKIENRESSSRVLLYISPDLENEMIKHCTGTKQGILTYLIQRGLDELKKDGVRVFHELN